MTVNEAVMPGSWTDPDDAPELTDEWFEKAHVYDGDRLVRAGRGRPISMTPKSQVTLRLDSDVVGRFRAGGPGWQTRINAALRAALGL